MRYQKLFAGAAFLAAAFGVRTAQAECPNMLVFGGSDPSSTSYVSYGCASLFRVANGNPPVQITYPFPATALAHLQFDPSPAGLVSAQSVTGDLVISEDGGNTWAPISRPAFAMEGPSQIAVSGGADPGVWLGASDLWFWAKATQTWSPIPLPFHANVITALAVAPDDPGMLFVGDAEGRIYVGEMTGGRVFSWKVAEAAETPVASFVFPQQDSRMVVAQLVNLAGGQATSIHSSDGGVAWFNGAIKEPQESLLRAPEATFLTAANSTPNCTPKFSPTQFRLANGEYHLKASISFPKVAAKDRKICQWFASEDEAWVSVGPHSGEGDGALEITVSANHTSPPKDRPGEIKVRVRVGSQGNLRNYSIPITQRR